MTRVGVGRWLGGGVEGAEWSAGESGMEINQYINVPGDTTLKVHYYRITGSR